MGQLYLEHNRGRVYQFGDMGKIMSKMASILACCVATAILSVTAQALPGSPVPARMGVSEVILVSGRCGHGFHRDLDGDCVANGVPHDDVETKFFGLPYVALPDVRLPYAALPDVRLPYAGLPDVRLPYLAPPNVGLPYVGPPAIGLRYIEPPAVGLPYLAPPNVGLPYIGPPEYVAPHACPYGYFYSAHHCVPT